MTFVFAVMITMISWASKWSSSSSPRKHHFSRLPEDTIEWGEGNSIPFYSELTLIFFHLFPFFSSSHDHHAMILFIVVFYWKNTSILERISSSLFFNRSSIITGGGCGIQLKTYTHKHEKRYILERWYSILFSSRGVYKWCYSSSSFFLTEFMRDQERKLCGSGWIGLNDFVTKNIKS